MFIYLSLILTNTNWKKNKKPISIIFGNWKKNKYHIFIFICLLIYIIFNCHINVINVKEINFDWHLKNIKNPIAFEGAADDAQTCQTSWRTLPTTCRWRYRGNKNPIIKCSHPCYWRHYYSRRDVDCSQTNEKRQLGLFIVSTKFTNGCWCINLSSTSAKCHLLLLSDETLFFITSCNSIITITITITISNSKNTKERLQLVTNFRSIQMRPLLGLLYDHIIALFQKEKSTLN